MSEKPSSRKRHRWSLESGDLVKVLRFGSCNNDEPLLGVVLVIYSANVYEGSSAEVLVDSEKVILESKYLIRIQPDPDISVIS